MLSWFCDTSEHAKLKYKNMPQSKLFRQRLQYDLLQLITTYDTGVKDEKHGFHVEFMLHISKWYPTILLTSLVGRGLEKTSAPMLFHSSSSRPAPCTRARTIMANQILANCSHESDIVLPFRI